MDINYPVFIAHWVNAYGWRARVRAPYGVNLNDPEAGLSTLILNSIVANDEHGFRRPA